MRKFLLTLVTVFIASFAMAQDYPVVTSVDELYAQPLGTMVEFQNLEVTVIEFESYGYTQKEYYLSDGVTLISGDVFPIPAAFTAIGCLVDSEDSEGNPIKAFEVNEVKSVSAFATLNDMVNYGDLNPEIMENSPSIIVKGGSAVCTSIDGNFVFYYTTYAGYYGVQYAYGAMKVADPTQFEVGYEIYSWCDGGTFKGQYIAPVEEYDDDWNLVSYKGGYFIVAEECSMWSGWDEFTINYTPATFSDLSAGYVDAAAGCRLSPGLDVVEKDGKYYLVGTYTTEDYVEGEGWVEFTKTDSIEAASTSVDLSQYAGTTLEDYVCGIFDRCITSDANRIIINKLIGQVDKLENIQEYIAKGEQYEEEITTQFVNPLKVNYVHDDGRSRFFIMVQDATGALALDYSYAIAYDEETNEPTADYAALKQIKAGDSIADVRGYAQYVLANVSPRLCCSVEIWDSNANVYGDYVTVTYVPTIVSSGAEVEPVAVVSVGEMLEEYKNCQENSAMPEIANNVVTVLDVQVIDSIVYDEPRKYLVQDNDTMELSNLWGERGYNFQCFERNNIVGIADYCTINGNYVYQLMPLSQEHITDATLIPEVELENLADYVGVPVILKNAETHSMLEGWDLLYKLQDDATVVYGLGACGKFDLQGIYEENDFGNTFTVFEVVNAYGFNTIGDLNSYINNFDAAGQVFDVFSEATVTYVDGENVFIQYKGYDSYGQSYTEGNVLLGVKTAVKIGDNISGIRGISTPKDAGFDYNTYENYFNDGARFVVADDANIVVVSSDNKVEYQSAQQLQYVLYNEGNYSGAAMKLFGGGLVVSEDGKYFYEETAADYEGNVVKTRVEIASNIVDLSTYVDQTISAELFLEGVYNARNTTPDARVFYVTGFSSKVIECENIAAYYALGEVRDTNLMIRFKNPMTVTYVHVGEYSYYVFVQDETGGLRIDKSDEQAVASYKVGDQISGVEGTPYYSWLGMSYIEGFDNTAWPTVDYPYEVVGTADVVAKEATIPELVAEGENATKNGIQATTFVNNLVEIKNVSLQFCEAADSWGEVMEYPCFVDAEGNKLLLPRGDYGGFLTRGLTTYEQMNVVGIADLAGINSQQLYTIYPRSQEDIKDVTAVKGVEVEGGIYLNAANQVVANGAAAIVVYDLNGRTVAAANAATLNANGLAQGVYVVRATYADGAVATAKIVR